jgi:hypothetical protein
MRFPSKRRPQGGLLASTTGEIRNHAQLKDSLMRFLGRRRPRRGFLASTTGDTQPGQAVLLIRILIIVGSRIRIRFSVKRLNWIRIKIKNSEAIQAQYEDKEGRGRSQGGVEAENKAVDA